MKPIEPTPLDATSRAIVMLMERNGYEVFIKSQDGSHQWTAVDERGERYIVRGDDRYEALCGLAERIGIDLEDG